MNGTPKAPDYYGRPRREMVAEVPAAARRVLDIGCGAGAFGAGLKAEWQRAGRDLEIWGVEMDPTAASRAAEVLDRVLVGDALALLAELPAPHLSLPREITEWLASARTVPFLRGTGRYRNIVRPIRLRL